jgi:tetratricopeptide (TPR) repeat protein
MIHFQSRTLVWYAGLPSWTRADKLPELSEAFASPEPPPLPGTVPPPLPKVACAAPHAVRSPRVNFSRKRCYIVGAIVIACIVIAVGVIFILPQYISKSYAKKGDQLLESRRYGEAIACYQKAVDLKPDAEVYSNMGFACLKLKRYDESVACYRKSTDIDSGNAESYSRMGGACMLLEKYDEALIYYQKAVAINPNDADTYHEMGRLYGILGNTYNNLDMYGQSMPCYRRAAELGHKRALALFGMFGDKPIDVVSRPRLDVKSLSECLENPVFSNRLKSLVGEDRYEFIEACQVHVSERGNNRVYFSGCIPHDCGRNCNIIYNIETNVLKVVINDDDLEFCSEDGQYEDILDYYR